MDIRSLSIIAACLLATCGLLYAADTPPADATAAAKPTTKPTTAPAAPTVMATVAAVKITSDQIDAPLKNLPAGIPPEQLKQIREKILGDLITAELVHNFLEARKAPFNQKDYDEFKAKIKEVATQKGVPVEQLMAMAGLNEQRIRDQVRLKALVEKETSKEKVDAFLKAHPSCFNGTKVTASHILLKVLPTASTKNQKAALAKLDKIAADVKAGTITFAKAAEQHSACPSGKKAGGDLGEFEFGAMVPPFALKAFAMKSGETSGVIRTRFGFHIIQVTKRTEGTGKPGTDSADAAKNCMFSLLESKMFDRVLTTCPVVIN